MPTARPSRRSRSRRTPREVGPLLPVDDPAIYPVSGGSEAIETALKLARAYHLARGEADRWIVDLALGQLPRQHARRARPVRAAAAAPARTRAGSAASATSRRPIRTAPASPDSHALGDADELAAELERAIEAAGPGPSRRSSPSRSSGRRSAPSVPPDDYWPKIAEVCRRHGVLLIADEVMTGFGRTGRWFGLDHWGVRPDILVAAKGATVGLLAVRVRRGLGRGPRRRSCRRGGFVHGFTYSHAPAGAAVAREVLRILDDEDLVEASATKGERLRALLGERLGDHRTSARSAAAACSSGSSWSPTARPASRFRGRPV